MTDISEQVATPQPAMLPAPPSGWETAPLPQLYLRAKEALAECERVDECAEWIRKADAFASYYRQAQDATLYNLAVRIRLRAYRRCGEIFLQIEEEERAERVRVSTGEDHARRSGLKAPHVRSAKDLAKIPLAKFEAAVDANPPPTISGLLGSQAAAEEQAKREKAGPIPSVLGELANSLGIIFRIREAYPPATVAEWIDRCTPTSLNVMGRRDFHAALDAITPWMQIIAELVGRAIYRRPRGDPARPEMLDALYRASDDVFGVRTMTFAEMERVALHCKATGLLLPAPLADVLRRCADLLRRLEIE